MIIITILAIWRLTNLITQELGPYDLFLRLRLKLQYSNSKLLDLDCFYCTSIWVAAPFALFTDNWLIYWLFYSAGAIIVEKLLNWLDTD